MYEISIIKNNNSYLQFKFYLEFENFIAKAKKICFKNTSFYKDYDILIYEDTLIKIFNHFKKSDFVLEKELKNKKYIYEKIPLDFSNNEPYRNLLIWILYGPKKSKLYSFQKEGVNFLEQNKRVVLADDMGLGKTLQVIMALSNVMRNERITFAMILAPNSLLINWKNEIELWAPFFNSIIIKAKQLDSFSSFNYCTNNYNLLILNYEKLHNLQLILLNNNFSFPILIADEAHRLRVQESTIYKLFLSLSYNWCWLMTGTPFENNENDLKSIISILDKEYSYYSDNLSLLALKSILRKYSIRRIKKKVLKDLPKKHKYIQYLEINKECKIEYNDILKKSYGIKNEKRIGLINTLLSICIQSKFSRCKELLDIYLAQKKKIVVFSFLTKPLKEFYELLDKKVFEQTLILTGENNIRERDKIIKTFQNKNKNVLLLSSFIGSVGLTFTEASVAIFLSEYWNPSANEQAEDRLMRIGQKNKVNIINLRIKDSIENNLESILDYKNSLNKEILKSLEI